LILIFIPVFSKAFFVCSASLAMMLILPFGKKGGIYHRVVSSTGLFLYFVFVYFLI
jgi:hypothetical protein